MRKLIFIKLLSYLLALPRVKKTLTVLGIIGLIGVLTTTAITLWAGVSMVQFARNQVKELNLPIQLENFQRHLDSLPKITATSCLVEAKSLMNTESWASSTAAENLTTLKNACFKQPASEAKI